MRCASLLAGMIVLAACDSPISVRPAIDAPMCPRYHTLCNPMAAPGQQGCSIGDKCTWVVLPIGELECGTLGCFPDGTLAEDDACTAPPVGQVDDCAVGLICAEGRCRDICDLDGFVGAACASGYSCIRHDGLFELTPGRDPIAGACVPGSLR